MTSRNSKKQLQCHLHVINEAHRDQRGICFTTYTSLRRNWRGSETTKIHLPNSRKGRRQPSECKPRPADSVTMQWHVATWDSYRFIQLTGQVAVGKDTAHVKAHSAEKGKGTHVTGCWSCYSGNIYKNHSWRKIYLGLLQLNFLQPRYTDVGQLFW